MPNNKRPCVRETTNSPLLSTSTVTEIATDISPQLLDQPISQNLTGVVTITKFGNISCTKQYCPTFISNYMLHPVMV